MSRNIEYIPETAFGEAKGEFKPVANFTMYGYNNTAAELFASLKGIKFVSIGESDMGLKQVKNFNVGEIRGEIECRDVKKQEFATVILEYTPIKNIKDYAVYVYDSRTKKYEFYAIGDEFKNDEGKAELGVHVRYDKEYKFKIRAFSGTYVPSSGTYGCAGKFSKAITIKVKKSDIERSFIYMKKEQSVKLFSESFLKNNDLHKLNEDDKKIISINTKGKIKAKKNGYASLYFVNKKTKKYVWFLIHVEEKDKYSGSLHFPLE